MPLTRRRRHRVCVTFKPGILLSGAISSRQPRTHTSPTLIDKTADRVSAVEFTAEGPIDRWEQFAQEWAIPSAVGNALLESATWHIGNLQANGMVKAVDKVLGWEKSGAAGMLSAHQLKRLIDGMATAYLALVRYVVTALKLFMRAVRVLRVVGRPGCDVRCYDRVLLIRGNASWVTEIQKLLEVLSHCINTLKCEMMSNK